MTGEEIVKRAEERWEYQAKHGGRHGSCQWCSLIINRFGYSTWRSGIKARSNGELPLVCAPCPVAVVFGKVCTALPEFQAWRPEHRTYTNVPPYIEITPLGRKASLTILELIRDHQDELVTATDEFLKERMK